MASMKPLDPNLRQQLAAMLSGDAKAGSVRADLVRGLLGSSVDDKDTGLLSMTPLGAAFDVSAADRDQRQGGTGLGHTLSAAAGMIPGAGEAAGPALKLGEETLSKSTPLMMELGHEIGSSLKNGGAQLLQDGEKSGKIIPTATGWHATVINPGTELTTKAAGKSADEALHAALIQHPIYTGFELPKDHPITPEIENLIESHGGEVHETGMMHDADVMDAEVPRQAISHFYDDLHDLAEKHGLEASDLSDLADQPPISGEFPYDANRLAHTNGLRFSLAPKEAPGAVGVRAQLEAAMGGDKGPLNTTGSLGSIDDLLSRGYREMSPDTNYRRFVKGNEMIHVSPKTGNALSSSLYSSPQELMEMQDLTPEDLKKNTAADVSSAYEASRIPKTQPPTVAGVKTSISDATKPQKVTPANVSGLQDASPQHIKDVSGGDAKKENFIHNAMADEGGNVPEEVADTLAQHLASLPDNHPVVQNGWLHDFADAHGALEKHGGVMEDALSKALSDNHSIPEMLAMHYDLDPERMGKAYAMPPTASKSRPTQ